MNKKHPDVDEQIVAFIVSLFYFEITREIAKLAGKLKQKYVQKGETLATADVIIAAAAITYGLILITKNVKHYPSPELVIEEI